MRLDLDMQRSMGSGRARGYRMVVLGFEEYRCDGEAEQVSRMAPLRDERTSHSGPAALQLYCVCNNQL